MSYQGIIIGLDLGSKAGVAEGCPGSKPRFFTEQLRTAHDSFEESWARALAFIAIRVNMEREINGTIYGFKEAADAGLIRVALEAPVFGKTGDTNHEAQLITKCLWANVSGYAVSRLGSLSYERVGVSTVRAHFLGRGNGNLKTELAKPRVMQVCRALGWTPGSFDEADAGAVWHWASTKWNPDATPPVHPLALAAAMRGAA